MKYLLDANFWLDSILGRAGAADASKLLQTIPGRMLATTDFALHAVGIYVAKRNPDVLLRFLDELIAHQIGVLHMSPTSLRQVVETMQSLKLDFDDAFQYVAAQRNDLTIVSFDADFDRTPRGRKTPAQVLAEIGATGQP